MWARTQCVTAGNQNIVVGRSRCLFTYLSVHSLSCLVIGLYIIWFVKYIYWNMHSIYKIVCMHPCNCIILRAVSLHFCCYLRSVFLCCIVFGFQLNLEHSTAYFFFARVFAHTRYNCVSAIHSLKSCSLRWQFIGQQQSCECSATVRLLHILLNKQSMYHHRKRRISYRFCSTEISCSGTTPTKDGGITCVYTSFFLKQFFPQWQIAEMLVGQVKNAKNKYIPFMPN